MFVLVLSGTKRVVQHIDTGMEVEPGELHIFLSGSFITIENRIVSGDDYKTFCVSYPDSMIDCVFDAKTIIVLVKIENDAIIESDIFVVGFFVSIVANFLSALVELKRNSKSLGNFNCRKYSSYFMGFMLFSP